MATLGLPTAEISSAQDGFNDNKYADGVGNPRGQHAYLAVAGGLQIPVDLNMYIPLDLRLGAGRCQCRGQRGRAGTRRRRLDRRVRPIERGNPSVPVDAFARRGAFDAPVALWRPGGTGGLCVEEARVGTAVCRVRGTHHRARGPTVTFHEHPTNCNDVLRFQIGLEENLYDVSSTYDDLVCVASGAICVARPASATTTVARPPIRGRQSYVTPLGLPNGTQFSVATGINSNGQVVGYFGNGVGTDTSPQ